MSPFAALPVPSRELRIEGLALGHGGDPVAATGVTVLLCPEGAVAAAEVRGTATGTRQFDSLVNPLHLATRSHALVFAGGSGAGLAAADAVVEHLAARGAGFDTGVARVPLVPTAILFDLAVGQPVAPGRPQVEQAIAQALASEGGGPIATGNVGVGTGATVGKVLGLDRAMKGGFGFASLTVPGGITVAALAAVNAFGDVRDPANGELVAGCRVAPEGLELADAARVLAALPPQSVHRWEQNTTLVAVLTDAELTKGECLKVCQMAFGGLYRTLSPALSLYDGDLVVTFALGRRPAHVHQVGVLAEHAVTAAILSGVRDAVALPGLPAARDLVR
ncbi:MAG: P1 family peptidase [Holophagales bacterium]|nr:MAG: P1 family peptidase [Holophagales bacterium]